LSKYLAMLVLYCGTGRLDWLSFGLRAIDQIRLREFDRQMGPARLRQGARCFAPSSRSSPSRSMMTRARRAEVEIRASTSPTFFTKPRRSCRRNGRSCLGLTSTS
jgi:hypothetical protein